MTSPNPSASPKTEATTPDQSQSPKMVKEENRIVATPSQLTYRQTWTPNDHQKRIGLTLPQLAYLYNAYENLFYQKDIPAKDHGKTITWRRMMKGFWEYWKPRMPCEKTDGEFGDGLGGKIDMFERECVKEMRKEEWLGARCPYNWSGEKEEW